jgi:hypothetical protein
VTASTAASAETLPAPSAGAAAVTSTGAQLVGTGYTDVSTLTIAGIIDPATGQITPTSPGQVKSSKIGVTPQITQPACAGRTDFYRIIDSSGFTRCFANSGTATLSSGYWTNITTLCPGANTGRTEYVNGSTNTWSVWRGPVSPYSTCYSFGSPVPAFAVQIQ